MSDIIVALIVITFFVGLLFLEISSAMMGLFMCGIGLGFTLFHGAYGFTAHWRRHILGGDGSGFRSEIIMIGFTALLFFIILGNFNTQAEYSLTRAPIGLSLIVGSFIFGVGMQLANGCGSGVMFSLGSGSLRMIVTLIFFMIGSLLGTIILPPLLDILSFKPLILQELLGYTLGYISLLFLLGSIFWLSYIIEKKRSLLNSKHKEYTHNKQPYTPHIFGKNFFHSFSFISGPWPISFTIALIVFFSTLILLLSGFPWSVTFGITIWAGKLATLLGIDISSLPFWQWPRPAQALEKTILSDVSSTTNIGLLFGAFLAASLKRLKSSDKPITPPLKSFYAAILGGLLLGIGARLGFGCNVGAFYSGTASGSLHGFIWLIFAFLGSIVGVSARPYFNLENKV